MEASLMLSDVMNFVASQSVAVGEALIIGGLIILIFGLIRVGVRTNVRSCSCGNNSFQVVKVNGEEYLKCKDCGDLLSFKNGIPVVDVAKFFVLMFLASLK